MRCGINLVVGQVHNHTVRRVFRTAIGDWAVELGLDGKAEVEILLLAVHLAFDRRDRRWNGDGFNLDHLLAAPPKEIAVDTHASVSVQHESPVLSR